MLAAPNEFAIGDILRVTDEESVRVGLTIIVNEILRLHREINAGEEMKMRVLTKLDSSTKQGKLNFHKREVAPTTINAV